MKIKKQQKYNTFYAITISEFNLDLTEIIQNYQNLYKKRTLLEFSN